MKRTKNINKDRFRKVHTFWKYSALFLAISGSTLFLTGCDEQENVSVYQTIQDCERTAADSYTKQRCALDYQNALAQNYITAPKYSSQKDCEDEFGPGQCNTQPQAQNNNSHSSFMWFPLMSGYSSSSAHYPSQPLYSSTRTHSPLNGKFVDAKGNSFGTYKSYGTSTVSRSALTPKPAMTTTTTRGGFGNTVSTHSAKASSHSSSHSFGG